MTSEETWQRARTLKQKQNRIDTLIEAAEVLFDRFRYDDITIAAIAREAGFTRSNTYKYFSSKEELFLEMLKHDYGIWIKELLSTLTPVERYSTDDFAKIWTGLLLKHLRLIKLFSILFTRIEKNLSVESLTSFKWFLLDGSVSMGEVIQSIYPELSPEDVSSFFNMHIVSAIGLFQMTDHTETQRIVMRNEAFASFRTDFSESCRKSAKYLLEGLLREC